MSVGVRPAGHSKANGLLALSGGSPGLDAVYTVADNGSRLRRLPLPTTLRPTAVAWSPNGRRLAFAASDPSAHEDSNLYVVAANGHGLHQLTTGLLGVSDVSWSPGGRWIAFAGWVHDVPEALAVRANGTDLHPVLRRFSVYSLAWGPNGRLAIAGTPSPAPAKWHGDMGIWTAGVNGNGLRNIVGPLPLPRAMGTRLSVHGWSPNGRYLLVQNAPRYGDISMIPVAGGHTRVLLNCPLRTCAVVPGRGMGAAPGFAQDINALTLSPDGSTVVFTAGFGARWRMYTVPARGGEPHLLSFPGLPANIGGVSWQPLSRAPGHAQQASAAGRH